jgi:large subunit ribosomal protein L24
MVKLKIKKGDKVKIIAGNERGKEGLVASVLVEEQRVVVEGLNVRKKHRKPSASNPQGGIEEFSAPVHISNVQLIDPKSNKPTKVGRVVSKDGKIQRVAKVSGEVIK